MSQQCGREWCKQCSDDDDADYYQANANAALLPQPLGELRERVAFSLLAEKIN
jgi:hypothetical protein